MLVITTLPHYIALLTATDYKYMRRIFLATTLSVAYHLNQSSQIVTVLDYLAAADLAYHEAKIHNHGLLLNILLFLTNLMVPVENYTFYHSLWHLASVAKTIYISNSQVKALSQDEVSEDEWATVL